MSTENENLQLDFFLLFSLSMGVVNGCGQPLFLDGKVGTYVPMSSATTNKMGGASNTEVHELKTGWVNVHG